jgi:hypothetical protein
MEQMKAGGVYFSGVGIAAEFNLLKTAGVSRILVDPIDLHNVEDDWDGGLALDCGGTEPSRAATRRRGMNTSRSSIIGGASPSSPTGNV